MMDETLVRRIVEAALLASPQPVSLAQLHGMFPEDAAAPPDSIERALQSLAEENGQRGIRLIEVASGFRFQVDGEVHAWVARLWNERPPRYSRALLETLALIAYRQPITRGEIEQVRGVAVSSNIIKTLEEREWVRVVGHRDVPGRPALYGTTKGFLDYFGLKSLDELPALAALQDLPDLEPELPLEPIFDDSAALAPPPGPDVLAAPPEAVPESVSDVATEEAAEPAPTASENAEPRAAPENPDSAVPDPAAPGVTPPSHQDSPPPDAPELKTHE